MNLTPDSLYHAEAALACSLVEALWQDTLLAVAAAATLTAMAKRSASARHAVGLLFLLAMLTLPLTRFVHLTITGFSSASTAGAGLSLQLSALTPLALPEMMTPPESFIPPAWLTLVWAGGVLIMLARLGGGIWFLQSLDRHTAMPVPHRVQERVGALREALGIARPVAIRVLSTIELPFSSRAWRPVIWLPLSMLTRLAPEHLEALIAHELAHVRRLDWLWNGLQCLIETLLFFHPAVWWLSNRVRREREDACDDMAAAVAGNPIIVAEALASLEALRSRLPTLALAANGGGLLHRITRLVSMERGIPLRWRTAGVAALLIGISGLAFVRAGIAAAPPLPASSLAMPATAAVSDSDPWWTKVGNSIEIRDESDGHQRDYHSWVDLKGDRHETYRVDGRPAPVDAKVRSWIAERHQPPAPPAAPAPPPPPAAPSPPPAPLPPRPASEDPAYGAIVEQLQSDARAVKQLGTPITVADDCGPCRIDDDSLSLHLSAHGPKGSAWIFAQGRRIDGQWRITTLELKSAG